MTDFLVGFHDASFIWIDLLTALAILLGALEFVETAAAQTTSATLQARRLRSHICDHWHGH